jgi:cystine transport system substrate-binding protein
MNRKPLVFLTLAAVALSLAACAGDDASEGADCAATASSLEEIKSAGVLRIGTEGTYPPYTFHDESDQLVGYDVEVAQAVAGKLGVEAEFVESKWDSLIVGLDTDQWNVVFNEVGISDERQEKYDFTTPYTYTRGAVIVAETTTDITSYESLKGKKAAQTVTSNYAARAEENGASIEGTAGFAQSIELVLSGRADATLNDDITFADYLAQHPDSPVKIAALEDNASSNAAILAKGQPELLEALNAAIKELSDDGTLTSISTKYFGEDFSKPLK